MRLAPFILAGLAIGGYFVTREAVAIVTLANEDFDGIFRRHGARYNVDWRLLKSIAIAESSLDPTAINPTDPSMGMMQILCTPDGKGGCANKFNIDGWPPRRKEDLLDPDYNVRLGAQILAWNIRTYGLPRGIAVYNAWDQRHAPMAGPFKNQGYVDKVVRNWGKLKEEFPL